MNGWMLFCCLVLFGYSQKGSNVLDPTTEVITGHVFYKDGSPVSGAEVTIHYFSPGFSSIRPFSTQTDEKGYFSLTPPLYGEGVISASKVSEGYPDAALALYGRAGFEQLPRIKVTEGTVFEPIDLKFGEPDAWIEWTVQSDKTHEPIKNARYTIFWPDSPGMMASSTLDPTGQFSFVLPKHPVTIKITAPGFADWVYKDEKTGKETLLMKPGVHDQRVVLLKKLP